VGAGLAGLGAALRLVREDPTGRSVEVVVVEARDRVGGRCRTDRSFSRAGSDKGVDLGAGWIHGVDRNPVAEFCDKVRARAAPLHHPLSHLPLKAGLAHAPHGNSNDDMFDFDGTPIPAAVDERNDAHWNTLLERAAAEGKRVAREQARAEAPPGADLARVRPGPHHAVGLSLGATLRDLREVEPYGEGGTPGAESLTPQDRRVLDWHRANLEYAMAGSLEDCSLRHWAISDEYGFEGDHNVIASGFEAVADALEAQLRAAGVVVKRGWAVKKVTRGRVAR